MISFVTSYLFLWLAVFAILSLMVTIPPRSKREYIVALLWILFTLGTLVMLTTTRGAGPANCGPTVVAPRR